MVSILTHSLYFVLAVAFGWKSQTTEVVNVREHLGDHAYWVQLVTAPFRSHGRRLLWVRLAPGEKSYLPGYREGRSARIFLHGYEPAGYSYSEIAHRSAASELAEHTEIRSLTVTIDGRRWPIHQRMIRDLLDPHALHSQLLTTLTPDGRTLVIRAKGSVHGSAYWVKWTFRRNGSQTRSDDDGPSATPTSLP